MDKLSYEEVIEELVIEAEFLEKDLEEANVMIDALEIEAGNWKRLTKILHELYKEQVEINKAKQDELDFQSEQLEELLSEEFMPLALGDLDDLGDFDDDWEYSTDTLDALLKEHMAPHETQSREATIEFVSLDDLVGTEDELYDPFKADRFS
jgi:hypothetical protein